MTVCIYSTMNPWIVVLVHVHIAHCVGCFIANMLKLGSDDLFVHTVLNCVDTVVTVTAKTFNVANLEGNSI